MAYSDFLQGIRFSTHSAILRLVYLGYTITRDEHRGINLISPAGTPCGYFSDLQLAQLFVFDGADPMDETLPRARQIIFRRIEELQRQQSRQAKQ